MWCYVHKPCTGQYFLELKSNNKWTTHKFAFTKQTRGVRKRESKKSKKETLCCLRTTTMMMMMKMMILFKYQQARFALVEY